MNMIVKLTYQANPSAALQKVLFGINADGSVSSVINASTGKPVAQDGLPSWALAEVAKVIAGESSPHAKAVSASMVLFLPK